MVLSGRKLHACTLYIVGVMLYMKIYAIYFVIYIRHPLVHLFIDISFYFLWPTSEKFPLPSDV